MSDVPMTVLQETENYSVWQAKEPDGEITYHIELGQVTLHFFADEWQEFKQLLEPVLKSVKAPKKGN
jgi:hypothetical protein